MRKMTKLFGLLAALSLVSGPALAGDAPMVSFTGGVDAYYSLNITNMSEETSGSGNGGLYGFTTQDNTFALGLAELSTKATMGDASANIVAFYGETAGIVLADPSLLALFPTGLGAAIGQFGLLAANLSITKDIWTFTFGKYATWMGNEVIEGWLNMNQSRSILFFGIPLYHTGFNIGVAPDKEFAATAHFTNGWNNLTALIHNSQEKSMGLQVKWMPADTGFSAVLNGIYGPTPGAFLPAPVPPPYAVPGVVGELILSYTTDIFTFVLDSQIGMNMPSEDVYGAGPHPHYYGFALYGKAALEGGWGIALRLEEVVDHGSTFIGGGTEPIGLEYREATLTIENKVSSNAVVRLEGRMDMQVMDGTNLMAYALGNADSQFTVTGSTAFFF